MAQFCSLGGQAEAGGEGRVNNLEMVVVVHAQAPVFHPQKAGQDLLYPWSSDPCSHLSLPLQETWTATIMRCSPSLGMMGTLFILIMPEGKHQCPCPSSPSPAMFPVAAWALEALRRACTARIRLHSILPYFPQTFSFAQYH